MNNQKESQELTQEQPKTRRKKLLTDPESLRTNCQVCKELGNLENMIYKKVPFADSQDKVLYGCYEGIYFCSEECQEKFKLERNIQHDKKVL